MDSHAHDIWIRALKCLREHLPSRTIKNWFDDVAAVDFEEEESPVTLVLQVPNSYQREFIRERHWNHLIQALRQASDQKVSARLEVNPSLGEEQESEFADRQAAALQDESARSHRSAHAPNSPHRGSSQTATRRAGPVSTRIPPSATPRRSPSPKGETSAANRRANLSPFHRSRIQKRLRSDYTFEQFVEGDSNNLARSAATAVAKEPGGTQYNPLFIYGGVGLGKTHLAQAIANHAVAAKTAETICYVSSEKFTNEFVQAIRNGDGNQFAQKYRAVDILIVDDVQFFGGKEKTQEEFFHLFNDLHQQGKQIVLCADRPSNEIEGIEERLLSRFQWGLSADIQRPGFEMRLAILHLKAESLNLNVHDEVLELMAENIKTNIRQLEGALQQLSARSELMEQTIDPGTAREFLSDHIDLGTPVRLQPEDILGGVASFYGLSRDDLVDRSRRQELVRARHVAMYLCRKLTDLSFEAIGLRFAGRDHSTVVHACNRIQDALDVEDGFENELAEVQKTVRRATGFGRR